MTGQSAHIYRYLMREWFNKLTAQARYDEPKLKKVRKDWLIYMELLEARETSNFLSAEGSDEAKRSEYGRRAWEEKTQLEAIEDAFAEAMGAEAVEKLRQIRAKDVLSFSSMGELAPDGYWYPGFAPRGGVEKPLPRKAS